MTSDGSQGNVAQGGQEKEGPARASGRPLTCLLSFLLGGCRAKRSSKEKQKYLLVLAPRALVDKLVLDCIVVAAWDNRELWVDQSRLLGVQAPDLAMPILNAVEQPGSRMAQLMDQSVPEPI